MALLSAFFDTTVLLAGLIDFGPGAKPAQEILDRIATQRIRNPQTAWHCCLEFYSVSTRLPEEFRLSPADALLLIEQELVARFRIEQLPPKSWRGFLQHAAADGVAGGRIYDAHIAEIAHASAAEMVVTDNRRDFVGLLRHGVRVLSPAEFLAQS